MRRLVAATIGFLTLALTGVARGDAVSEFSELSAVANSGAVAGAACTPGCTSYGAFLREPDGTVHHFGTLGGFASIVGAVNGRGLVVGQSDTAVIEPNGLAVSVAFAADDRDGMRSLGTLPGYVNSQAYGVNDLGEVVGWSYNTHPVTGATLPTFHGFLLDREGVMHDLGTLGGPITIGRDIANDGTVVGASATAAGRTRAFAYRDGTMVELPSLGGNFAEATGINERGSMVGSATYPGRPNNARRAVLWDDEGIHDLGTLGGPLARAWRINSRGDVAGQAMTSTGQWRAVVWRNGVIHDLGTLGGANSFAFDISDAGVVVGLSETGAVHPDFGPVSHGFVVGRDGVMRDVGVTP